jgi:hypothetical protein
MTIGDIEKAATIRELALELLAKADSLDGEQKCECGHQRQQHDPAGWNAGWCEGRNGDDNEDICECEEFKAW